MPFQNRRQKIVAVLMSVWLCSWIGVTLLHGISHAAQGDVHSDAPCVACALLHQNAPATLDFEFAPRNVAVFECAVEIRAEVSPRGPQVLCAATSPRGPPTLLFV